MKIFQAFSMIALVMNNPESNHHELDHYTSMLDNLLDLAPAGDGFDAGVEFLSHLSNAGQLIFNVGYRESDSTHMEYYRVEALLLPSGILAQVKVSNGNGNPKTKVYIQNIFVKFFMQTYP